MWSVMQSTLGSSAEQIAKYMLHCYVVTSHNTDKDIFTGLDKQKGYSV